MPDPGQDRDDWVRSIVSPSAPLHRPAQPGTAQRLGVGLFGCLSLLLVMMFVMLLMLATNRPDQRQLYENHAIATKAVVIGFEMVKPRKGPATVKTVVEFDAGGYRTRTRLLLARLVPPELREAWVGRTLEIRYLPGQPDTAIADDAMDQLPGESHGWPWLVLALAVAAMALRVAIVEWRKGRR